MTAHLFAIGVRNTDALVASATQWLKLNKEACTWHLHEHKVSCDGTPHLYGSVTPTGEVHLTTTGGRNGAKAQDPIPSTATQLHRAEPPAR